MKFCYSEINIPYGWDSRKNIVKINAFEHLKVIDENDKYCLVKKVGRGQRRQFLADKNYLIFL